MEFWNFCTRQSCQTSGHSQTLFHLHNSAPIKTCIWIYQNHFILLLLECFLIKLYYRILVFHIIIWNLILHIKTPKVQLTCKEDKKTLITMVRIESFTALYSALDFHFACQWFSKIRRYGNYIQIIHTIASKELEKTAPSHTSKLT
jgi:hypothetical protein